jgi:hypothetical protein
MIDEKASRWPSGVIRSLVADQILLKAVHVALQVTQAEPQQRAQSEAAAVIHAS